MAKCDICGKNIEQTFLAKIIGTHIKDEKGKKHKVCSGCQKKFKKKDELLKALK
jgi:hypothetical protein